MTPHPRNNLRTSSNLLPLWYSELGIMSHPQGRKRSFSIDCWAWYSVIWLPPDWQSFPSQGNLNLSFFSPVGKISVYDDQNMMFSCPLRKNHKVLQHQALLQDVFGEMLISFLLHKFSACLVPRRYLLNSLIQPDMPYKHDFGSIVILPHTRIPGHFLAHLIKSKAFLIANIFNKGR